MGVKRASVSGRSIENLSRTGTVAEVNDSETETMKDGSVVTKRRSFVKGVAGAGLFQIALLHVKRV